MPRKPGSQKEKKITRKNMRADIVGQWVGAKRPLDLNKNISRPSDHIEAILESIGVRGGLDEDRVKEAWSTLAGELIAKQTEPVSLRKGCLTLKVLQPAMRYHLEQLKPGLLRKLQNELGADNVLSLRLTIG
jgi:predicted nucleic acid-binding Zn ribbon protein